jgi:flagellar FliL protein
MKADPKVEAPRCGRRQQKLIIIIVALLLVLGAVAAVLPGTSCMARPMPKKKRKRQPRRKRPKKAGRPAGICRVEPFTVNLQPGEAAPTSICNWPSRWK